MAGEIEQLAVIQADLVRIAQAWALRQRPDLARAARLRRQAALLLHAHYRRTISVYRRLADQEGVGALTEPEAGVALIQQHLMLPDDLFKSYDQRWLDDLDFGRMNTWLAEIFHQPVAAELAGVRSIDAWIDRLAAAGLRLVYSSGTSGNFSFVPRDLASWGRFRRASAAYLTPLLSSQVSGAWQRWLMGSASRLLPLELFARLTQAVGLKDYDAFFLDFSRGHTGNQTLAQELGPLFRRHAFLYQADLSPTVLRLAARGPRSDADREQLARLQAVVSGQRAENYGRIIGLIREATAAGQKVFIFGTTHQYKELCDDLAARGQPLALRPGSLVLFGGGWKSFRGVPIPREQLLALMTEQLGLPPARILEGYSMTELNAFMLRCEHGRFHIPPLIEPVLFDEEMQPLAGAPGPAEARGLLGFLDPLATAYPGFLISGDEVRMVSGECACGLAGPAVLEIRRAGFRELKGCGGIMASLAA